MTHGLLAPLQTLSRRAAEAKSAKERHDVAYHAWEAALRLAVAMRPPATPIPRVPSTGDWAKALSVDSEKTGEPALVSLFELFVEVGIGQSLSARKVTLGRVVDVLPAYRNKVIAHGAPRPAAFYEGAADVLVAGLEHTLARGLLWPPGGTLAAPLPRLDADELRWIPIGGHPALHTAPADVVPGQLYFVHGDEHVSLHPYNLLRSTELGDRVLFFNGWRGKHPRYLDYLSGDELGGLALAALYPRVTADLEAVLGPPPAEKPAEEADFEVLGDLGQGGMGIVELARQRSLSRLVALKRLPESVREDLTARVRFEREVSALSRCDHPNVIRVVSSRLDAADPFYAMEVLQGANLAEIELALSAGLDLAGAVAYGAAQQRERHPALDELGVPGEAQPARSTDPKALRRQIALLFRDAARGLQHLHDQGIVHRDVKPANLMVTERDHRVVIMDLGLASMREHSLSITRAGSSIVGTIRYAAPEQLRGDEIDRRADVYGLGATFFELFTRRPLREGDDEAALLHAILDRDPPSARSIDKTVPDDLSRILQKATHRDPAQRYESAAGLAEDLDAFLEGRAVRARPPSIAYAVRVTVRRNRGLSAVVGAAVLAVLVAGPAFVAYQGQLLGEARAARREAEHTLGRMWLASGRRELEEQRPLRALPWLLAAYERSPEDLEARALLAQTLETVERLERYVAATRIVTDGRGERAIVADGRAARVVAWETGHEIDLQGLSPGSGELVMSADGSRVAQVQLNEIRVWDSESGRALATIESFEERTEGEAQLDRRHAALSEDGSHVVTTRGALLELFRVDTGARIAGERPVYHGQNRRVHSLAFDPSARRVLLHMGNSVYVWSRAEPPAIHTLDFVFAGQHLDFSHDGTLLAGAGDALHRGFVVWDSDSLEPHRALRVEGDEGLGGSLDHVAFQPGARRIAVSERTSGRVLLYALDGGEDGGAVRLLASLTHHDDDISFVGFSEDGSHLLTAGEDRSVAVFRFLEGGVQPVAHFHDHPAPITRAQLSPDRSRLIASTATRAFVWTLDEDPLRSFRAIPVPGPPVRRGLAVSPDGTRVAVSSTRSVAGDIPNAPGLVTIVRPDEPEASLVVPTATRASRLTFSHDGAYVVVGTGSGEPVLFRSIDGRPVPLTHPFRMPRLGPFGAVYRDTVGLAAASGADRFVIAPFGEAPALYGLDGGRARVLGSGASHDIHGAPIAISPNGEQVVVGGTDGSVTLFGAAGARDVVEGGGPPVTSVAFSPDGAMFAAGTQTGRVSVRSTANRRSWAMTQHSAPIVSLLFTRDGDTLYSVSEDGLITRWDTLGEAAGSIQTERSGTLEAHLSPDEDRVMLFFGHGLLVVDLASERPLWTLPVFAVDAAFLDGDRIVVATLGEGLLVWSPPLETRDAARIRRSLEGRMPWTLVDGALRQAEGHR